MTPTQYAHILVVLVLYELDDDLLLGLQLQQLEQEAHEVGRLALAAICATNVVELDRLVHKRLGRQAKAVLLPVQTLVDFAPQDVLHQVLRQRQSMSVEHKLKDLAEKYGKALPAG